MSQTVSVTHFNIRVLIDDLDPEARAISTIRMTHLVDRKVRWITSRTFQPLATTTTISLVAGTFDYNLSRIPTSVRQLILNSDGVPLERLSLPELNATYRQDTAVPLGNGTPRHYALYELDGEIVRVRIGPTPAVADTVDVYYDAYPTFDADDMTTTIALNKSMLMALEKACAAECLLMMTKKDLARRKVNPAVAQAWMAEVEQAIADENWRHRMYESQERVDEVNAN